MGIVGVPWETTFGERNRHIPVEIFEDGREVHEEDEKARRDNKIIGATVMHVGRF